MRDAQLSQMINAQQMTCLIPQAGLGEGLEFPLIRQTGARV